MIKINFVKFICVLVLVSGVPNVVAQINVKNEKRVPSDEVAAFQIFDSRGKKVSYSKFIKAVRKSFLTKPDSRDVLLFGELHDNPISHWLELQVTQDLFDVHSNIVLGAEMFETDQQTALNEYLNPKKDTAKQNTNNPMGMGFGADPNYTKLKKSIKLWNNFATDYQPLVDFARDHKLQFVATNVPRRYASMVYKKGIKSLYKNEGHQIPKTFYIDLNLPVCDTGIYKKDSLMYFREISEGKSFPPFFVYDSTLQCYKDIFAMAGGHGGQNLPMSQAIKDATMAWQIYLHLPKNGVFVHYNGSYHSDNHQSIEWYLKNYNEIKIQHFYPMKITTISTRTQQNVSQLEKDNVGIADFVIVVPENMTRTYK
jgi:hypothetical protein